MIFTLLDQFTQVKTAVRRCFQYDAVDGWFIRRKQDNADVGPGDGVFLDTTAIHHAREFELL